MLLGEDLQGGEARRSPHTRRLAQPARDGRTGDVVRAALAEPTGQPTRTILARGATQPSSSSRRESLGHRPGAVQPLSDNLESPCYCYRSSSASWR